MSKIKIAEKLKDLGIINIKAYRVRQIWSVTVSTGDGYQGEGVGDRDFESVLLHAIANLEADRRKDGQS